MNEKDNLPEFDLEDIVREFSSAPKPEPEPEPVPEETETPTPEPTEDIVPTVCPWAPLGDVNIDNVIDAEDALLVLKHAAKLEILTGDALSSADVTDDGNIDASDALEILKTAARIN